MRQLGGRLPEPPQLKTDVETLPEPQPQQQQPPEPQPLAQDPPGQQRLEPQPLAPHEAQQPQPHPVEVHRIERHPVDSRPAAAPPSPLPAAEAASTRPAAAPASPLPAAEAASARPAAPPSSPPAADAASARPAGPAAVAREQPAGLRIMEAEIPEPQAPGGRWEEFGEFRRLESGRGRGSRISLEPMIGQPPPSRGLLGMEQEPEHRSSFLTIAVPGIAAILAIGGIVWSGSLRDRVHQQDEQMTALQEQNRKLADKLADTLAQVGVDQKPTDALNPDSAPASAPASTAGQPNASKPPANPAPPPTMQAKAAPAQAQSTQPAPQQSSSAAPVSTQAAQSAGKHEGVSVPPPMRASAQGNSHGAVDPNYHPMIVPPYPTNPSVEKTGGGSTSQPAASQQTYREPFAVNGSSRASSSPVASSSTAHPNSASQPGGGNSAAPQSSPGYAATSNGMYASALAQNIETVETLQRQSAVPLREFHASDGVPAKIMPGLAISVRSPDQARGTYALVVNSGGASYQLRGRVNSAVGFTNNVTHRGYELVVLHIAGGQAYGYLRPVQ
jgi:hypothetical protein